jgi:hypothetical protein
MSKEDWRVLWQTFVWAVGLTFAVNALFRLPYQFWSYQTWICVVAAGALCPFQKIQSRVAFFGMLLCGTGFIGFLTFGPRLIACVGFAGVCDPYPATDLWIGVGYYVALFILGIPPTYVARITKADPPVE